MVLPSQMEELSELTDGLTPLQGLQTRVMVCKTPHLKLPTFTVSVLLAITDLTFAPQTYWQWILSSVMLNTAFLASRTKELNRHY